MSHFCVRGVLLVKMIECSVLCLLSVVSGGSPQPLLAFRNQARLLIRARAYDSA
jgi:hypothetical protein